VSKRLAAWVTLVAILTLTCSIPAEAAECGGLKGCPTAPTTGLEAGQVTATYFEVIAGSGRASNQPPPGAPPYRWRLRTECEVSDPNVGACQPGAVACEQVEARVITYYIVQRQRLALPDGALIDGQAPPVGLPEGTPFGLWETTFAGCVDITDLNPPPSPDEVFRYFQTLPLPQLTTRQQPPGAALVGLPVIFFTDSPTTQTFTVDIRGFAVVITARATSFAWTTGDGTTLTTTDPGAPYPDQTVTHDYAAGTYTASLTTTWGGTFTVDGGAAVDVPGTTTTDGVPTTFVVRQAHSVLTNPYD
jgi:hypothetical protein